MIVHTYNELVFVFTLRRVGDNSSQCVLSKCFNLPKKKYHNLNEVCRQWRGLQELCRQKAIKSAYMYSFSNWNHRWAASIKLWCKANDTHTAPQLLLKVTKIFCESATLQSCESRVSGREHVTKPKHFYLNLGTNLFITLTISRFIWDEDQVNGAILERQLRSWFKGQGSFILVFQPLDCERSGMTDDSKSSNVSY